MKITEILNEFKTYHGSSRMFDKFSLGKVLSGEGNVSYGYGIYIAGNPGTGKHYAMVAYEANKARIFDKKSQISAIKHKLARVSHRGQISISPQERQELIKTQKILEKEVIDFEKGLGKKFYELNVNDDIVPYLFDLDKKLSEQTPQVKKSLAKLGVDLSQSITGFRLLKQMEEQNDVKTTSEQLHAAGISGTKYLDRGSRDSSNNTFNYVIFDPANITITKVIEL